METKLIVAELKRELAVRESVYPSWIQNGRLSSKLAAYRKEALAAAIERIEAQMDAEQPTDEPEQLNLLEAITSN